MLRLKQIAEEEAASLQLIQSLQEEERMVLAERRRQENEDRSFARKVLSSASVVDDPVAGSDAEETLSLEASSNENPSMIYIQMHIHATFSILLNSNFYGKLLFLY